MREEEVIHIICSLNRSHASMMWEVTPRGRCTSRCLPTPSGGNLAPSFFSPTKMTIFLTISILAAKISDDLFFDQVFRIFTDFPDLYFVKCRAWPFPHNKTTFFTLFMLSRTSDNTTSQNIVGGRMHGPSPHLKLWGDRPPVPLGFRPWLRVRRRAGC